MSGPTRHSFQLHRSDNDSDGSAIAAGLVPTTDGAHGWTYESGATDLGWFNVKTAGTCVGDGATDDTVALQAAIAAATASGTKSATLYFPPGTYLIGGALQDTSAFNGQILLPSRSTADPQITIRIVGAARPPLAVHGGIPAPGGYSIIRSSLTGASGTAACISGGNGAWPTQNNVQVILENLICLAPGNPTFTFLNISTTQGGGIDGVYVSTTTDWAGTRVQPTHSNAYGIKLPQWGQSNQTYNRGIVVGGFYTGVLQGELSYTQMAAAFCVVAVELPFSEHWDTLFLEQTACTYGIKVSGDHASAIWYDAEHWASPVPGPAWAVTVYDVDDGSNLLYANLLWWGVAVGGVPDHAFTINGGSHVQYSELGSSMPPSFGAPALTLGTSNAAGSASTAVRTDATIAAFDATVPTTSAVGDAAATGSASKAARRDHAHGREALSTATPLVASGSGAVGTGVKAAREDHVHPAAATSSGADDHIHVVGEAFSSDGVATSFLLANEAIPGTVAAYDVNGARKAVTLGGMNDQITYGASPGTGTCLVDYVPLQV